MSNSASIEATIGRFDVQVNSHLVTGSHTASSEVFKNTIIVLVSPPVMLMPESILHLISVAEVSLTKQSILPTAPFLLI